MRPTDHLVAGTERPLGPPLKPHPYQGTGICAGLTRYVGRQDKANKIDLWIAWARHGT